MNRLLKIAVRGAVGAMLVSATVLPASASYLGYGNGDPGNWDLWQEQNGGKPLPSDDEQAAMWTHHHEYYDSMAGSYEHPYSAQSHSDRSAYAHTHRKVSNPG